MVASTSHMIVDTVTVFVFLFRTFELKDIAKIKTVFPDAFIFRQEKNIPGIYGREKYAEYQLTVEGTDKDELSSARAGTTLEITTLMRRREDFRKNLINIVMQHHKVWSSNIIYIILQFNLCVFILQDFLHSLDTPVEIPNEKIFRWHPSFQLDTVPDIEESELPKPPETGECIQ